MSREFAMYCSRDKAEYFDALIQAELGNDSKLIELNRKAALSTAQRKRERRRYELLHYNWFTRDLLSALRSKNQSSYKSVEFDIAKIYCYELDHEDFEVQEDYVEWRLIYSRGRWTMYRLETLGCGYQSFKRIKEWSMRSIALWFKIKSGKLTLA